MTMPLPDDDAVREALRQVEDPEAGMNIVDLGLVYAVEVGAGAVRVDLTMTTAACPMADMIVDGARDAISAIVPAGTTVDVRLVWDPPWTPDKMTGIARDAFRLAGLGDQVRGKSAARRRRCRRHVRGQVADPRQHLHREVRCRGIEQRMDRPVRRGDRRVLLQGLLVGMHGQPARRRRRGSRAHRRGRHRSAVGVGCPR